MRSPLAVASVALLSVACATTPPPPAGERAALAEVKSTGTPGEAVAVRTQSVTATVKSVDVAARTITLEWNGGVAGPFKVGTGVTRFDEIFAGDAVQIDVEQQLRLEAQAPGAPSVPFTMTGGAGARSEFAGGVLASTGIQATVTVTAVDQATRKVTFQDPAGATYEVKAGPGVRIEKLQAGDRLLATYVEATAVRLEKAAKKP